MPPGWLLSSSSLLRDSGGLHLRKLRGSLEHGALISLLVTTVTVAALLLLRSCSANSEGDALYALRQSLDGPWNVLQSWHPTLFNPYTWIHVTCNDKGSVIRVDLGNAGLSGSLVPELGNLHNLKYLELGKIPCELGNLKALVSLDLYHNFTGCIPSSLGKLSNLSFLHHGCSRIVRNWSILELLNNSINILGDELVKTIREMERDLTGRRVGFCRFENNPRLNRPCH
ncbi:hypothetical protein CY35_18G047600 [Sphagnum magellanicum]|nr:hypothetical protein CY35_18G047600 [Sphagnum magellanicum]